MLEIRYIDHNDAELVSKIIREAYADQMRALNIDPVKFPNYVGLEGTEAVIQRMEQGDRVLLAFLGDEPIGTISYRALPENPSHGHVKRFAILPCYQGSDYGIAMMSSAEDGLRQSGVTTAEIALVAEFDHLRDYYIGLGYTVGETKSFSTVPFNVLFMEKALV